MADIIRPIIGKNPLKKVTAATAGAVLEIYAEKAKARFADHGREYTNGIGEKIERQGRDSRVIGSEDQRAIWVNLGTEDHYIAPRNGTHLAWQTDYRTKTRVGVIPSRPGGRSGPFAFSTGHMVSGIEARESHVLIGEEIGPDFIRVLAKRLIG